MICRSFAYYTLRSRLPVTLTSIIDSITKDKDELISKYGEVSEYVEALKKSHS